ncbi:MAG: hypothetical protein Q4G68_14970 [Planctomycetia bacterium]|nr:hypothetical protein [Planctomycetia bacterium]
MNQIPNGLPAGSRAPKWNMFRILTLLLALFLLTGSAACYAQGRLAGGKSSFDDLTRPSTSKSSAQEALRKIPWNSLSSREREQVESVLNERPIYRRLPMAGGYCNPELFDLVLCNPEIVVSFWDVLGYPGMSLQRTGPWSWHFEEQAGTLGDMELLYHDNDLLLLWARGRYKGPGVTTEIVGDILLILQIRYTEDQEGEPLAICRMDSFVRVYNVGYELMSRMFAPLLGRVADANFTQTVAFVGGLSRAMEENPAGVHNTVLRMKTLSPEVKEALVATCVRVEQQLNQRVQGYGIPYTLMPKKNAEQPELARILARDDSASEPGSVRSRTHTGPNATPSTQAGSVPGPAERASLRIPQPAAVTATTKSQVSLPVQAIPLQASTTAPKFSHKAEQPSPPEPSWTTHEPAADTTTAVASKEGNQPDHDHDESANAEPLPVLILPELVDPEFDLDDWSDAAFSQSTALEELAHDAEESPVSDSPVLDTTSDAASSADAARELLFQKALKALEDR